jgi:hypothetical protein
MGRLSVRGWCEVVCEECSRAANGRFVKGSVLPKSAIVEDARNEGYLFDKGKVFCSTDCMRRNGLRNVESK